MLGPDEDGAPVAHLETLGLLQRFVAETTMTEQDQVEPGFWSGLPPSPAGDRPMEPEAWIRGCERARGFDRWCASLREWRCGADIPATPALRRAWFVDWVAERWGEESAEQAELELDPWTRVAIESLDACRLSCEAATRAVAGRALPAQDARRRAPAR